MPDGFELVAVRVQGFCPACGGESLILAAGGHLACGRLDCPRPGAAGEILTDRETEHIVTFGPGDFTIRHPLRERLDDALMDCDLHEYLFHLIGPPAAPGRYRARPVGDRWKWEVLGA